MAEKFKTERSSVEQEGPMPLISLEENRFIEDTGGVYRGFVEGKNGRREFEEVWVNKCAYYDDQERAVVETFVATEGVNDEGGDELQGPSGVEGFSMIIIRRKSSGEELGKPDIISLQPKDFSSKKMSASELRRIAHDLHKFVAEEAPQLGPSELRRRIEARLLPEGWQREK